MEVNNFNHIGAEAVIENLMIHSVSPRARKLVEAMYTENPYEINIRLDQESTNRTAEIVNTYLKAIGLRLIFAKVPKYRVKLTVSPFSFEHNPIQTPFIFATKDVKPEDREEYLKTISEIYQKKAQDKNLIQPFSYEAIDRERRLKQYKINEMAIADSKLTPRERYEKYKKQEEK